MPLQTLQILGSYGFREKIKYDRIEHRFSDGSRSSALVGNSAGTTTYVLNFDFLPDTELMVTDPAHSDTVTWAVYLPRFFADRMADGAAFNIVVPRTGSTVAVALLTTELDLDFLTYKLYSTGLELRQYRTPS